MSFNARLEIENYERSNRSLPKLITIEADYRNMFKKFIAWDTGIIIGDIKYPTEIFKNISELKIWLEYNITNVSEIYFDNINLLIPYIELLTPNIYNGE